MDPEEACQRAIEAGLVVHCAHPLNGETSIPALIGGVVMPSAQYGRLRARRAILKRLAGLRVMEAFVVLTPTLDDGLLRGAIVVSGRHHRCGTGHVYHHDRMHPISGGR
jgi:hypothetical protein